MANRILLRDMALVMTSEHFKKNVSGVTISNAIRRLEYPVKLDAVKRSPCNVTKGTSVKNNAIIVIPNSDADVFYLPFLLDSLYVKAVLLNWSANVSKITNIPVPVLFDEDKDSFSKLEKMLLAISIMGEQHISYEYFYAAERLFADIRDAISFEIYVPELLNAENIHLIDYWKEEVKAVEDKHLTGYQELLAYINSILSPNNALYDNLKRFYLLADRVDSE